MKKLMKRGYISMDDTMAARPSEEDRKKFDEVGVAWQHTDYFVKADPGDGKTVHNHRPAAAAGPPKTGRGLLM